MDAIYASVPARLKTFEGAATKSKRPSSRSKKAAPKTKAAWPHTLPSSQDLAFAGFVWKPTSASPDNVQCVYCSCQLDGWEESDVPAFEHLTHSPTCGYAITSCIRLRQGDPGRAEDDPMSDAMIVARRGTFAEAWPLDPNEGFPSMDQMAAAGWIYDPTEETPDGVTCPYCSLSLDAWDAGDDPLEEHRKRASDCLFFALQDMYKPAPKAKGKRTSKRASSVSQRTSTASKRASTTSKEATTNATKITKTTKATKATRASARSSTASSASVARPTRGKKRTSEAVEDYEEHDEPSVASKRLRSNSLQFSDEILTGTPKMMSSDIEPKPIKISKVPVLLPDSPPSKLPTEIDTGSFEMSSFPPDLLVGTPKQMPTEPEVETLDMDNLPSDVLVGTPRRTPPRQVDAKDEQAPPLWEATDIDAFFTNPGELPAFLNNVVIDAGLDNLSATGADVETLKAAVLAGLTDAEKKMTIEQWVLYNAKRGEEKLRMACEQQIAAFDQEAQRALRALEAIPTY